jgi:type IV secretory pathway VirB2 component (pilin)
MFCSNGHENTENAKFCRSCGQALGAGANPTMSAPTSAQTNSTASVNIQSLKADLISDLQAQRHTSPPVNLQTVITLISGALYALAVLLLAFDAVDSSSSDSPFLIGFVWTAIGSAVVFLLVKFLSAELAPGATTALIPLLALSVLFLFGNAIDDGEIGLPILALGLVYMATWALPILRGRPALLAAGLLSTGLGFVTLTMQSSIRGYSAFDYPTDLLDTVAQESSTLFLIVGIVLLATAWRLDRKDWPSLGRIFIGVGIVFESAGVFGVVGSSGDRTGASLLLAVAGILLITVAVQRSRKTSLLVGGFGGFAGVVAFISAITENSDGPGTAIVLTLLASAGFGFLGIKKATSIQNKIQSIGQP